MTFNSIEFLIFYPTVLLLYFLLPKRARWPMLLLSSYVFYMSYRAELVILIFATTLVSYLSSIAIEKSRSRGIKRLYLTLTLITSLGVLFFYKYFDFLSGTFFDLASVFGYRGTPLFLNLALPVGISFYTFQTLSYVIDVYRGLPAERNFFFYALFVSFFPQLVAGPIERPTNLMPQLRVLNKFSADNAIAGAKMMLIGFFKKICVADFISGFVDSVYNAPSSATSLAVILATVLFAIQIYCDFSGYTDIAIGCARVMGIRLMKNFDRPYSARTVREFWSRWHISLSSWFKDYLYIPLGGNRVSLPRNLINVFIVFIVSGLWHGASWTFVLWGALHGIYQIVGRFTLPLRNAFWSLLDLSENSIPVSLLRRVNTFILVCFAWLLFRANSISDAGILLGKLFSGIGVLNLILLLTILPLFAFGAIFVTNIIKRSGISDGACLAAFIPMLAVAIAPAIFVFFDLAPASAASIMGITPMLGAICAVSILLMVIFDRIVVYDGAEISASSHLVIGNGMFIVITVVILLSWYFLLSSDMVSNFIYFQF